MPTTQLPLAHIPKISMGTTLPGIRGSMRKKKVQQKEIMNLTNYNLKNVYFEEMFKLKEVSMAKSRITTATK